MSVSKLIMYPYHIVTYKDASVARRTFIEIRCRFLDNNGLIDILHDNNCKLICRIYDNIGCCYGLVCYWVDYIYTDKEDRMHICI